MGIWVGCLGLTKGDAADHDQTKYQCFRCKFHFRAPCRKMSCHYRGAVLTRDTDFSLNGVTSRNCHGVNQGLQRFRRVWTVPGGRLRQPVAGCGACRRIITAPDSDRPDVNNMRTYAMSNRRILSLWFPRLAAERALRLRREALPLPFAIVGDQNGAQVLTSLNFEAEAAGLRVGQPLRDATAMCPGLRPNPPIPWPRPDFLTILRRWAGKFSPWVAEEPPRLGGRPDRLRPSVWRRGGAAGRGRTGLRPPWPDRPRRVADTRGAAWALARFAGRVSEPDRSGDAIDQRRGRPGRAPSNAGAGSVAATPPALARASPRKA